MRAMRKLPVGLIWRNPRRCHDPQISLRFHSIPSREEGRIAIVTKRGAGCSGRGSAGRRMALIPPLAKVFDGPVRRSLGEGGSRTAKPCGPGAPTLASSFAEFSARRRWQKSPVTGESTEHAVKTIAQGRLGEPGVPVVTMLVCFFISHARLRVRRAPGFPCALFYQRDKVSASLGRNSVARSWTRAP